MKDWLVAFIAAAGLVAMTLWTVKVVLEMYV